MQTYQLLGVLAALLVVTSLTPHCYRCLRDKQCTTLSTVQLLLLALGSVVWMIYGIRDSAAGIVLLSIFSFSVSTILLAQRRLTHQREHA